jgi:hypothetical protein
MATGTKVDSNYTSLFNPSDDEDDDYGEFDEDEDDD